jgi:hypothetical protein
LPEIFFPEIFFIAPNLRFLPRSRAWCTLAFQAAFRAACGWLLFAGV